MDYTKFSVEDLASDDRFIEWVNRTNPDAERFWDNVIATHPEMNLKVMQARTLVLNLRRAEAVHHSDQLIDSLWQGIEDSITRIPGTPFPDRSKKFSFSFAPAAAFVIASISAAIWFIYDSPSAVHRDSEEHPVLVQTDFIEEVNTSGNVLRVHLSDGSTVALEDNSRLRYKKDFTGQSSRKVYLTGEAFFEVAKDPGQPFLVHTGEVVTRVLGTSFRIKAQDHSDEVVVSVTTGKVSVYTLSAGDAASDSGTNAVILMPNQQVTYLREQDAFGRELVADPKILLPGIKDADFTFENTPIKDVFKVLQRAYGIEIIFDEEIMSNCFITAPLGSEPLFEKLRVICRTIGARFETIDAKVVVTSTGC